MIMIEAEAPIKIPKTSSGARHQVVSLELIVEIADIEGIVTHNQGNPLDNQQRIYPQILTTLMKIMVGCSKTAAEND